MTRRTPQATPDPQKVPGDSRDIEISAPQPPAELATIPADPPELPTTLAGKTNQVLTWILEGASEYDIRESIAENFPGDDAGTLINAVLDKLKLAALANPTEVRGFCLESTRFLYQKLVDIGDFGGALRAIQMLHNLAAKGG